MGDPIDNSQDLIDRLKSDLGDQLTKAKPFGTDFDLLRFLQGYDFKYDVTLQRLQTHLRFRNAMHPPPGDISFELNLKYREYFLGQCVPRPLVYAKNGSILFVELFGRVDFLNLNRAKGMCWRDIVTDRLQHAERLVQAVRQREAATGEQSGIYLIWDMEGFNISFRDLYGVFSKNIKPYTDFFSQHLVELFTTTTVINASPAIYRMFNFVSPLLPERTRQRVKVLSPTQWREELLKDIDANSLPDFLGGNLFVDKTGNDLDIYSVPNPVRHEDLFDKSTHDMTVYKSFSVGAKKMLIAKFAVSETAKTSGLVTWSLFVNSVFSFTCYFQPTDTQITEITELIIPDYKPTPPSEHRPEYGEVKLTKGGVYKFVVRNDHQWFFMGMHVEADIRCTTANGQTVEAVYEVL